MPHVECKGSPVALMDPEDVKSMRAEAISAMAAVPDCGFVERQVRPAIPSEVKIELGDDFEYKPVLHVSFAHEKGRTEDKLDEVCAAGAAVLYGYFAPFGVEEVQYTWDIDFADRFGRFPPKVDFTDLLEKCIELVSLRHGWKDTNAPELDGAPIEFLGNPDDGYTAFHRLPGRTIGITYCSSEDEVLISHSGFDKTEEITLLLARGEEPDMTKGFPLRVFNVWLDEAIRAHAH